MALSKSKTDFEVEIAKAVGKKIKYCRENYYRPVKEIVDGEFKGTYKPVKMLITQSRLAKFLGVSFQQIQKFEKGAKPIRDQDQHQIDLRPETRRDRARLV